jgi:hypothetical protein
MPDRGTRGLPDRGTRLTEKYVGPEFQAETRFIKNSWVQWSGTPYAREGTQGLKISEFWE